MGIDESPDTEEQLTSQDFIKEGPIERGVSPQLPDYVEVEFMGTFLRGVAVDEAHRADMFKAMAFEADKEAKRLQARVTVLEGLFDHQTATIAEHQRKEGVLRAALLDIEGRVATWRDSHWFEAQEPGNMQASVMLAILAVVKRVK